MPYPLERFRGIFPAALTMFDRDNNFDEEATARHWDWLITSQKADGWSLPGPAANSLRSADEERLRVFRLAQSVVQQAGAGDFRFRPLQHQADHQALRGSAEVRRRRPDRDPALLPEASKPAVIEHYRRVRKATSVPIMLYNNPHNSACVELNPREIAQLVDEDVLHMVKSTFGTVEPVHDLSYLGGRPDGDFLWFVSRGLRGIMCRRARMDQRSSERGDERREGHAPRDRG